MGKTKPGKPTVMKYKKEWEAEKEFAGWLEKTSDTLIAQGFGQARCRWCRCCLRAHKGDLKDHIETDKHKASASAFPRAPGSNQSSLLSHGFRPKSVESKKTDMKLAVHIACHSSVKTVDHLGEVLKKIAPPDSYLENLKLHRTKCSKIIAKVVAPSMLQEIVNDIGDGWYSAIVDESTDNTAVKWLAIALKFYNYNKRKMVVEFVGLVETPRATADVVYREFKSFMVNKLRLNLGRMFSLGTDGGLNLCGSNNSLFALLKRYDCPNLHLVKCICHGLDKCSSQAGKCMPASLEFMLRESRNWFSHSSVRKLQYEELHKELTGGVPPPQLVRLAATRWLAWYGAVKAHLAQYRKLQELFKRLARADAEEKCHMAHTLSGLHEDESHLLYLSFLQPVLRETASQNVSFQRSSGDVCALYSDLKSFVFTMAKKVVRDEALKQTGQGMLRITELQALKCALQRPENFLPIERVKYGENFYQTALDTKLTEEQIKMVKKTCAEFLVKFTHELTLRLPSCIEGVEKMEAFSPGKALGITPGRKEFRDLPLKMINDPTFDKEAMETQWEKLATLRLQDVCPGEDDVANVSIIQFWGAVYELKSASGQRVFRDLAMFVLALLTLPVSNAVIERLFSLLALVKTKVRNRLGLVMLEAILLVRTHLHAYDMCCKDFEVSQEMLNLFNSKTMYGEKKKKVVNVENDPDEETVDDPAAQQPEEAGAAGGDAGNDVNMLDLDDDFVAIPEWDAMLDLLAEVDELM